MLDSVNAYGKVKLRGLYYEVQRIAPEYTALYRFQYGSPRRIRDNKGTVVVTTQTGVKPGCPLSNNYYVLAAASMQRRMASDLKTSEEECSEQGRVIDSNGKVIGYLDDMYLINDPRVTAINTPKLAPAFADHGAELCIPKCEIVGQEVFDHDDVPDGWKLSQSGAVAVGVPFGDRGYKRQYIQIELRKKYPPRLAASIMSPRLLIALILFSYSKRGSYLINTSNELQDTLPLAEDFDRAMIDAVAAVAQAAVTKAIREIINLPQRYSGWGLQEIGGLAAEAGQLSGALKAKAYISENCTLEQIQELTKHINTDIVLGTSQDLCEATGIKNITYDTMTAKTASRILWNGKDKAQNHKSELLIAELGEKPETRQHAAALLSKGGSGSRYILSGI
jgi:predicted metal-dependent hydrolase